MVSFEAESEMREKSAGFFRQKLVTPIKNQLNQGTSPLGLARTCAVGATLAIVPLLGATTALCAIAGVRFKLNQPLIQLVNYLLYPVQLLLLPVFIFLGAKLTGSTPVAFNPKEVMAEFTIDPSRFMKHYGLAGLHAVLVWVMICPFLFKGVEWICIKIFKRWSKGEVSE